jgi:hypothetical protein
LEELRRLQETKASSGQPALKPHHPVIECGFGCNSKETGRNYLHERIPLYQPVLNGRNWDIFHNASPFEKRGHFLIIPDYRMPENQREQRVLLNDLQDMLELDRNSSNMLIFYNSPQAGASQNHIHFQGVYRNPEIPYAVEMAEPISRYIKDGVEIKDLDYYGARAIVFEGADKARLADVAFRLIERLQKANNPFNLDILDGKIYLFPRNINFVVTEEFPGGALAAYELTGKFITATKQAYGGADMEEILSALQKTTATSTATRENLATMLSETYPGTSIDSGLPQGSLYLERGELEPSSTVWEGVEWSKHMSRHYSYYESRETHRSEFVRILREAARHVSILAKTAQNTQRRLNPQYIRAGERLEQMAAKLSAREDGNLAVCYPNGSWWLNTGSQRDPILAIMEDLLVHIGNNEIRITDAIYMKTLALEPLAVEYCTNNKKLQAHPDKTEVGLQTLDRLSGEIYAKVKTATEDAASILSSYENPKFDEIKTGDILVRRKPQEADAEYIVCMKFSYKDIFGVSIGKDGIKMTVINPMEESGLTLLRMRKTELYLALYNCITTLNMEIKSIVGKFPPVLSQAMPAPTKAQPRASAVRHGSQAGARRSPLNSIEAAGLIVEIQNAFEAFEKSGKARRIGVQRLPRVKEETIKRLGELGEKRALNWLEKLQDMLSMNAAQIADEAARFTGNRRATVIERRTNYRGLLEEAIKSIREKNKPKKEEPFDLKKELEALARLAPDVGRKFAVTEGDQNILVMPNDFFKQGNRGSCFAAERKKYKARFELRQVLADGKTITAKDYINKILETVTPAEAKRAIALVPHDSKPADLECLKEAGLRFIPVNMTALADAVYSDEVDWESFRQNTYAITEAIEAIKSTETNSLYRIVRAYLSSPFFKLDGITAEEYIAAIVAGDIARLLKAVLRPATRKEIGELKDLYDNISYSLIFA